ncbi:MAG: heterodisulfide reductase subunit [Clostridia bacterium]|jgi:heterodisulfide reductase subunit B|nr:heterodisulfide reductase subunit [Clostridia bacterium]MDN5322657.1 heterodisulfide reductase subunit [Clostridia bacterium]
MIYQYYPGCSLHASARDYDESVQGVVKSLAMELKEVPDWNCCGATITPSLNQLQSQILPARNLALAAENRGDVVVPCNACYMSLKKIQYNMAKYKVVREKVTEIFGQAGLRLTGMPKVRHLLEVILEDVGLEKIKQMVKKPLKDLKVVNYSGCQLVRPLGFDNPEDPQALDNLMSALGAEVLPFSQKTHCCGGSLITTQPDLAFQMVDSILEESRAVGADMVVVTCPMCQLNLDAYQDQVNRKFNRTLQVPITYFTQLMGLALGLNKNQLGLQRGIISPFKALEKIG